MKKWGITISLLCLLFSLYWVKTRQEIIAVKVNSDLYVRSPWNHLYHKIWRIRVNNLTPVDFIGERLIPAKTPNSQMVSEYHQATENNIHRHGVDEAPPIRIDGQYVGGNHGSVTQYTISPITLDGNTLTALSYVSGEKLTITESYTVKDFAVVQITRAFDYSGLCSFEHTVTPKSAFKIGFHGGVQAQKPIAAENEQILIKIPDTKYANGLDITKNTAFINITSKDWNDPLIAPSKFYVTVGQKGNPERFGWLMIYDKRPLHQMRNAFFISNLTKLYPRGYDPLEGTIAIPGQIITMKGRFGTYNPASLPN